VLAGNGQVILASPKPYANRRNTEDAISLIQRDLGECTMLAVGVLLRRELRLKDEKPSIPARFKLRGKILDGLAKYNPKDSE